MSEDVQTIDSAPSAAAMNEITLEQTLRALERNEHVIDGPEETAARAVRALGRMISSRSVLSDG